MRKSKINVLSLFDGISCGLQALDRAGYDLAQINYFASEIDPAAIKVAKARYPQIQHIGDVTNINVADLPKIHLIIAGSPCQSISKAGTGVGISTKQGIIIKSLTQYMDMKDHIRYKKIKWNDYFAPSALFWEFIRLREQIMKTNPKVSWLLENVNNPKWNSIITDGAGGDFYMINSSVLSAQNRERCYWTNIPLSKITDLNITIDHVIPEAITGVGIRGRWNESAQKYIQTQTQRTDRKSNCLVTKPDRINRYLTFENEVKIITPEHAELLQTIDKGFTDVPGITKAQRYHMIGNAWTVDVIVKFFENLQVAIPTTMKKKQYVTF